MQHNVENHTVEAILHYDGANDTEPTTIRRHCTVHDPCHVVNCPFPYFPQGANTFCLTFNELEANDNDPAPQYQDGHSEEHFLNFAFPGEKVTPGSVNGRKFEFPGVSSLTQPNEIGDYDCSNKKHDCGVDKVCYCHYNLKFKYDRTVQMIWTNMGSGKGWSHPVHLHGHSFYVLKMGYPVCNQTTAKITGQNPDVYCGGPKNFCNAARWMNSTWKPGNVPGLNLKNPPRKDTIIVPTGGYVVVRIRSNNPGRWFMHCHIEVHSLDGMAMFIDEAPDQQPKPPKGFPICQNFYHDNSRDVAYTREPSEPGKLP